MNVQQPGFYYDGGIIGLFFFLIWLAALGLGIYAFVLFVKLARRGITALDLYIYDKKRSHHEPYAPKDQN
ncbi:hypothetical protein [Paenibacillus sp. sgz500958]|uniref:hypothetical protein n=1 Tax=Paenibacillus sp. sgz500958 TaxID=3242475 RepID=UPI0036D3D461